MHAARTLFAEKEDKDKWGLLLVDAENAFNTGNRIACLWTMQYRWPSSARLSMKCYHHQALLLVRADDGYAIHWLASREEVTQRNPLTMILYGIGILPLTLQLKATVPSALQLWYADDAAAGDNFNKITKVFSLLLTKGPARGYLPKLTKSILVVKPAMVDQAEARFNHLGFQAMTGTRYLGSFVGMTAN